MTSNPPPDGRPYSRVLVVDDDASVRTVLRLALHRDGHDIREAANGREALELLPGWAPDVVVSDLLMPQMDGIELLRQARATDDTLGFVVLTGVGTTAQAIQALRLEADDYLLKPFDVEELSISVKRAIERRALVRQNRYYQQCLEMRVAQLGQQLERLTAEALISLAGAVEARDGYTGAHLERVTRYSQAVGAELQLDRDKLRTLWIGSLLHDIGKISIPDRILNKPSALSTEELEVMREHPRLGAAILEQSSFLSPAVPAVLHHHERWDGGGYPFGLQRGEIPIEARVLAVTDAYDAIVTDRAYRARRSEDTAMDELRRCAGSQFDPEVVEAFIQARERGFPEPVAPRFWHTDLLAPGLVAAA
ncbi:MAG TPA: HD domain-containing phosphohydrolase [Longimicrobium sp.]|nr:HD domain-containing phosphohydrolase [Longimicrobium sp.]